MISKAQSSGFQREAPPQLTPKLTAMERTMLRWVVLDPGDKVLDANTQDGLLLEYLYRNMECEICGVSTSMEHVKQSRSRLQHADIIYARAEDIPWRESSFDAVLLRKGRGMSDHWPILLEEILRVLKPGGQFLLGTVYCPSPLRQVAGLFASEGEDSIFGWTQSKTDMVDSMQRAGFQQVTWQRANIASGVLIGWKPLSAEVEAEPKA